ncbi:RhuM family protein, partial [Thiolapillus sp.]
MRLEDETLWLTLGQMAELFGIDKSGISRHLKNIYETNELQRNETVAKFATVQPEGGRSVSRMLEHYNLDAIISVGYRVNSIRGTQFRIWATERLREYLVKGFVLDDERLKEPQNDRYFEELLARIRDIRSSEKVFWRKVLDIYATSVDYNPKAETSQRFFQQVQNKMHWAAHGHTAAELIYQRADASKHEMGITNYPGNKLLKRDVEVAKNYLSEEELAILNRIVTAYLELAELQALN